MDNESHLIKVPGTFFVDLFVLQGPNDPRVLQIESDEIVDDLNQKTMVFPWSFNLCSV